MARLDPMDSESCGAIDGFANDVRVTGVPGRLLDHVVEHVTHIAFDDVVTGAATVQIQVRDDRVRLGDRLAVPSHPEVHGVGGIHEQVRVPGVGPDLGPAVTVLTPG